MNDFLIALGGNIPVEDRSVTETLELALDRLAEAGLDVARTSRWFRTPAWPAGSGPDFVNGAAVLRSSRTPREILEFLHGVERHLGRVRKDRWAPRICDLDLLGAGDLVLPDRATVARWMDLPAEAAGRTAPDELILPHPRLHERGFVLVPLADVAPDWMHPMLDRTVQALLDALPTEEVAEIRPL